MWILGATKYSFCADRMKYAEVIASNTNGFKNIKVVALLDLNDDCLIKICSYLDLPQQVVLKNALPCLQSFLQDVWRHEYKKAAISYDVLDKFIDKNKDFYDFMSSINENIEELKFDRIDIEQFKLLENLKFPKLQSFDYNLWHSGDDTNDQDTLQIARMFPQLTKLTFLSSISGKYIWMMSQLVDLDLSCCEFLDTEHFEKIFSTLKLQKFRLLYYGYNTLLDDRIANITRCQTLEELTIDDHHLLLFIDGLLKMPKMHKITCYTCDYDEYLIGKIADAHGPRIDSFIYNGVFWSKDGHARQLIKMKNLRRLVFVDDDVEREQLQSICEQLQQLEEFYFLEGREKNLCNLLAPIKYCDKLKLMDLSNTKINREFLQEAINIVAKQAGRQVPLMLRCFGSGITSDCLESLNHTGKLHVSIEKSAITLPYTRCIECIWKNKV